MTEGYMDGLKNTGADQNPDILRYDYVDKLFDPAHIDMFTEVTEEQRNVIAYYRALDQKFRIPVLDAQGNKIWQKDEQGNILTDAQGNPLYQYRGGLPGVMKLCDNFERLNVSLGRQGRREHVKILEPKANVTGGLPWPTTTQPERPGLLTSLLGGKK